MHQPAETASQPRSRLLGRGVANMLLAMFAFAVMNVFAERLAMVARAKSERVTTNRHGSFRIPNCRSAR